MVSKNQLKVKTDRRFKMLEVTPDEDQIVAALSKRTGLKKYAVSGRIVRFAQANAVKIFGPELEYEQVVSSALSAKPEARP